MRFLFLLSSLLFFACGTPESSSDLDLINGSPVNIPQVVRIVNLTTRSACTATIVGPRVIVTAAHCANNGQVVAFRSNGVVHRATVTRSPLFPGRDHDVALGLLAAPINIPPATIGGAVRPLQLVDLTGFGCTQPGGGGGNDGILRQGVSRVIGFSNFDFVTRNGAALCFGDSGGPAFQRGSRTVIGVNSKGNISTTSFMVRMDLTATRDFFKNFERTNSVDILGI